MKFIFSPFPLSQGNTIPGVLKFHGLITTFEMIMADCPELKKLHWRCVVIDEAHRLKNRNCKLLEGLKLMNLVSLCVLNKKKKKAVVLVLKCSLIYPFFFSFFFLDEHSRLCVHFVVVILFLQYIVHIPTGTQGPADRNPSAKLSGGVV